jgi:hypothetical protein
MEAIFCRAFGLGLQAFGPGLPKITYFSCPAKLSGQIFLPKPGPTTCFGPMGRAIFGLGWSGRASHARAWIKPKTAVHELYSRAKSPLH